MSTKKEAWGIEVGAQAIKVMKLGRTATGVALLDFDVLPFKSVLTTPDLNVEEAIRVNLEAVMQKHDFEKAAVTVSVPGHMAFARFAKLPPIEASRVKSIVAYEAQQQIPFPIDEVEWDYQVFAQEDAPDIEVGIFAITKERLANFLANYRAVGMHVDHLTLSPVAVYNAFAFESGEDGVGSDNTVYLDIGAVSTDIIVVEDGGIWLRTLPLGGNHFTQALMNQFKISFAKAEKLKLEAGTSKYAKQIYQAMRGVFNDLVTEIQRSLGFYTSLNRDSELTRLVGVGSTWKLPGLQKYLKQNLQMQVVRPDGFAMLEVEDRRAAEFSSVAVNMATAYGLALQGLGMSAVDANILPQSVLRARMWKAKQPWIGAAAACVVGAAAVLPAMQFMAGKSFESSWREAKTEIDPTIAQASTLKAEFDKVQTSDPRPGIRNYRRSFDYVNLYPNLLDDVTTAMATIEPNEAIKDINWNNPDDVAKVAEVPRYERDLVWVREIQTAYAPPTELANLAGGGSSQDASKIFVPVPYPDKPLPSFVEQQPSVAEGEPGGELGDDGSAQPVPDEQPAASEGGLSLPRVIVTVKGATTMDDSEFAAKLREKFVGWMKQNTERGDRPYILVPKIDQLRLTRRSSIAKRKESGFGGSTASDLSPTPTRAGAGSTAPTLPGPGGLSPGGFPGDAPVPGGSGGNNFIEVKTPEGWYAQLSSGTSGFSVNALLPKRMLSNEEEDRDFVFSFSFELILMPPDDARKTILPPDEQDPEQPDTQQADGEGVANTDNQPQPQPNNEGDQPS